MDVEGMNGPSVQTFDCHKCGNSFSHAPQIWNVGGIPARSFFFCSPECLTAYLEYKPAPRRREPHAEDESVGLSIDILDADRLREWARLLLLHGPNIGHWGSVTFVAGKMQIMATCIEKAVRDIGTLRSELAALREAVVPPPASSSERLLRIAKELRQLVEEVAEDSYVYAQFDAGHLCAAETIVLGAVTDQALLNAYHKDDCERRLLRAIDRVSGQLPASPASAQKEKP